MTHDVYIWGDSHWRVFADRVNNGPPGVMTELYGVRTIDMCANELSGATMWGLLNPNSKNGARRRILGDLDGLGGVDNVGLTFGEVDARYPQHHDRYFNAKGVIIVARLQELVARFRRFIEEDLLESRRVTGHVFFAHGYVYPKEGETLLQPGQPMGQMAYHRATDVNTYMTTLLEQMLQVYQPDVTVIRMKPSNDEVSADGVHLRPEVVHQRIFTKMSDVLTPPPRMGLSW